jgi:myosin heavy subunit
VEDIDLEAGRDPKRRKLIHHASRRVSGRAEANQELIISLSNELEVAMRQLQESNVALNTCQQSKKMQHTSRWRRAEFHRQQQERIVQQDQVLRETTARLEEREKMVHDLSELNDINRLLITRYQEHENFEADLEDEENSRSSRD